MIIEVGIAVVLGAWLALTGYKNLPRAWKKQPWLNRVTGSWLVPSWAFFAPVPGTKCYHVLYRDLGLDGLSAWRHVQLAGRTSSARFLWNPQKTQNKALIDLANEFSAIVASLPEADRETPPRRLQVSLPYLTLLSYVTDLPRLDGALATQFALGQTGVEDASMLVVSTLHRLPEASLVS